MSKKITASMHAEAPSEVQALKDYKDYKVMVDLAVGQGKLTASERELWLDEFNSLDEMNQEKVLLYTACLGAKFGPKHYAKKWITMVVEHSSDPSNIYSKHEFITSVHNTKHETISAAKIGNILTESLLVWATTKAQLGWSDGVVWLKTSNGFMLFSMSKIELIEARDFGHGLLGEACTMENLV
jgi:hypothetical protein